MTPSFCASTWDSLREGGELVGDEAGCGAGIVHERWLMAGDGWEMSRARPGVCVDLVHILIMPKGNECLIEATPGLVDA